MLHGNIILRNLRFENYPLLRSKRSVMPIVNCQLSIVN